VKTTPNVLGVIRGITGRNRRWWAVHTLRNNQEKELFSVNPQKKRTEERKVSSSSEIREKSITKSVHYPSKKGEKKGEVVNAPIILPFSQEGGGTA